jgi:hypothetical protein
MEAITPFRWDLDVALKDPTQALAVCWRVEMKGEIRLAGSNRVGQLLIGEEGSAQARMVAYVAGDQPGGTWHQI